MTRARTDSDDGGRRCRPGREWVTFDDPERERHAWQIDVTFLHVVVALHLRQRLPGCAHRAGARAGRRVAAPTARTSPTRRTSDHVDRAAKQLTDDEWQFASVGRKKGIYAKCGTDEDGKHEWRTRLVDDACIFLNRPGFDAGPGCALHLHAMRTGQHHSDIKPEVCWQLPLRRGRRRGGRRHVVSPLSEFGRDGWGEGGEEFAWWCTEAPEAFTGVDPVYVSLADELRKMLGKKLYRQVSSTSTSARRLGPRRSAILPRSRWRSRGKRSRPTAVSTRSGG